jgi:hypothetical protein
MFRIDRSLVYTVFSHLINLRFRQVTHRFEWDAFDYHSGIHSVQWKLFDNYTGSDEIHGQSHIHAQGNVDVSTDTCDYKSNLRGNS